MKSKKALIVESPTKAKTLSNFLKDFEILSCKGHIRDLPEKQLGVDVQRHFRPTYVIPPSKKKIVDQLKKNLRGKDEVFLATDPDREGEAIAWHLKEVLKLGNPRRIVFHEITKNAVEKALASPREINEELVEAQQARRILDRLVGFSISPLLWQKVKGGGNSLSAGRVQSVALRFLVEREREIEAFKPEEYWTIHATFEKDGLQWEGKLQKKDNKELKISSEQEAEAVLSACKEHPFVVSGIKKSKKKKKPPEPFRTSTLQQEGNRKLDFSANKTMMIAQQLYEGIEINGQSVGLITYMRTDSVMLSETAKAMGRKAIEERFGKEYLGTSSLKAKKVKGAQEAHEAIRPTDVAMTPDRIKEKLSQDQFRLYDLIFRRYLASLMKEAEDEETRVQISCGPYLFQASGLRHLFDGFRKVFPDESREQKLPDLKEGETLALIKLDKKQHFTQPPPRYTEAGLVKKLEDLGIGRPSTYAPTLQILKKRSYCELQKKALVPTELGKKVCDLLVQFFPAIMDADFTARMETELDKIEEGKANRLELLQRFYGPFKESVEEAGKKMETVKVSPEKTDLNCEKCGSPMVIRRGRYGKFLACSAFPRCKATKPFESTGIPCPEKNCNGELMKRQSARGHFYGCSNFPRCTFTTRELPRARTAT